MSEDSLAVQLAAIEPVDERERRSIELTLARLAEPGSPFDEHASPHHLTASAFVISSRGVILHRHKRLGIWVQPGGHVDAGETPEEAALRETREETGLNGRLALPPRVFHVDVHPGPNAHTHYDLRYVVVSEPDDPAPPAGESPEVYWFDFASAPARAEASLAPALERLALWRERFGVRD